LPVTGARGPGFHGWDALTLGMKATTRLFPLVQAAHRPQPAKSPLFRTRADSLTPLLEKHPDPVTTGTV